MDLRRKTVLSAPPPGSPAAKHLDRVAIDLQHPDLPHPDSPAGRCFEWQWLGIPHPDSPVGRVLDWQSELLGLERQEQEDHRKIEQAADALAARLFSTLREALPESLKATFDRHVDLIRAKSPSLLQTLQIPMNWFGGNRSFGVGRGEVETVWQQGTLAEKQKLLETIRVIAERHYETTSKAIRQQLTEAQRTGKHSDLEQHWKREFLQGVLLPSAATVEELTGEPETYAPPPRRRERPKKVAEKTWIEFQLVDEEGNPVPNVKYKVTLPDGSIKDGTLNQQGSVRFDDIDPGECEIGFPEIDGREWSSA